MLTVLAAIAGLVVGACLRRDCDCDCARIKGHLWGPVHEGGPLEEGGECVRCGLYASESHEECLPEEKTLP